MDPKHVHYPEVPLYCHPSIQDDQYYHLMCELSANKKQKERLGHKIHKLQNLLEDAKKENKETLTVSMERYYKTSTPQLILS